MSTAELIPKIHELIQEAEKLQDMSGLEKKAYVIEKMVSMVPEDQKEAA